jgi:alpha-glucosidase
MGIKNEGESQGSDKLQWWKNAVIYQIYPRSFQDSNGDGTGDLRGIIRRLPYLAELGVDAVWLSPIFPSPMADFGYDVANYVDIDPVFGTLADFDELVARCHAADIRVLLDLVPNHTSDQHPWFMASRSSRDSPRRNWYLWQNPGSTGAEPNNWLSEFGGSAWAFDPATGQYYYHAFLKQQPDLNWRNPEVRQAIYDVMRFWLRRGVDGFRVDVLWHLIKDDRLRDNPANPNFKPGMPPHHALLPLYTTDRPEMEEVVAQMRRVVDEFDDRLLIGEIYLPIEKVVKYYGRDLDGVHLPFNFSLLSAAWNGETIAGLVKDYEAALPPEGWPNWVLGNHDRPRIAGRVGREQARVAAMLLFTLRGTATVYYGDEIGMSEVAIPADRVRDPFQKNLPNLNVGRDGSRTPMQWSDLPYAGFSEAEPWLPVAPDFPRKNVEAERDDSRSMLNLYHRLIALRRSRRALTAGSYRPIVSNPNLLAFVRERDNDRVIIALNLGNQPAKFATENLAGEILISSYLDRTREKAHAVIDLRANEGVVISLAGDV